MKMFWKWTLRSVSALLVLGTGADLYSKDRTGRLNDANILFAEENIVHNFSHMKDVSFWKPIPNKANARINERAWPVALAAPPENYSAGSRIVNLAEMLEDTGTTSLIVLHGGKIVHEKYYLGTGKEDRRVSWSVSKSVLSAMLGIAIDEGKIASLDEKVVKYVPMLKGTAYDGVTIIDVLNMASGVKFNEDYLDYNSDIIRMGRVLAHGGSIDEFTASFKEREREAGSVRHYISNDTQVLGMVLRKATGKSLMDYLAEKIWSKIGSGEDIYYLTDRFGVAIASGGLTMRTRDYARFGQLFLNRGKWGDEQIVPADWVAKSTRVSAPSPVAWGDEFGYGYQWWIPLAADGEYFAAGIYGQYIYINPKADIVVVKTSAHRKFHHVHVKRATITMFRAIAEHYSDWRHPHS